jgi:phage protein D
MINQVPLLSQARNPRVLLKINDLLVREVEYVEYVENNLYLSDSFHVKMPVYNITEALNIEYWLSQPAIMVEIFVGFPQNPLSYTAANLDSLIVGAINNVLVRIFDNGGWVEFDGFDLSKILADNKTTEKYQNLTSSQIATKLAVKHGLIPQVTETTTKAGYYYNQDYVQLQNSITEWDLIVYLAQKEGFQVFVRGKTLYFQPRPIQTSEPYVLQARTLENGQIASFNGESLVVSRNLNYARDVIVRLRSWNAKSGRVEVTARATPTKKTVKSAAAQPIGEAQVYEYVVPGLSQQQAQDLAQKYLQDISQHERLVEATLPGDNILHKDSVIQLAGVCASADQQYYPDTITRRIVSTPGGGGYSMDLRAKNHSPQSIILA